MRDAHLRYQMGFQDRRKREFLGLRLEKRLHQALQEEAERRGTDLSKAARQLIAVGLTGGEHDGRTSA